MGPRLARRRGRVKPASDGQAQDHGRMDLGRARRIERPRERRGGCAEGGDAGGHGPGHRRLLSVFVAD
jgi:hypothetical protein